jgi:hypothetical protein
MEECEKEEGRLRNKLKRTTEKSKKEYLESTRHEVMEFQETALND